MTAPEAFEQVNRISRWLAYGCGNHGCRINPPRGMGTNATCQCSPIRISQHLLEIAARMTLYPTAGQAN